MKKINTLLGFGSLMWVAGYFAVVTQYLTVILFLMVLILYLASLFLSFTSED